MGKRGNWEVGRWGVAIAGALLIHALLAATVVWYVEWAPGPTVSAELDLSSVELSFESEKAETAEAVAALPQAAKHEVPVPKQEELPPEVRPEKRLPPEPGEYRFPEPKEELRMIETVKELRRTSLSQARLDAPPRPKCSIKAVYPKGALRRKEQGIVVLEIEIGADGACVAARVAVSCGFAELDAAAVKAALAASFVPAKAGDRPVASTARLPFDFRLSAP